LALPLFAVTLFVSAFLLFLVQPMIGKMILPKLGGTPQVWNTCMLFFQVVLLAGYAYTHNLSTRLPTRKQLIVHAILLAIPFLFLMPTPFDVRSWFPDPTGVAVVEALRELAILVGVPFFVVSTSAPLLQRWFVATGHPAAKDPYFLYGASNLGSLLSLLFYPLLFEPWFTLRTQADLWLGGYLALVVMIGVCIVAVLKAPSSLQPAPADAPDVPPEIPVPPVEAPPQPQATTAVRSGPAPGAMRGGITRKKGLRVPGRPAPAIGEPAREPAPVISRPVDLPVTAWRRLRWVLLAAVPSSLMLGVTSYISTDLSPFPLIWVVPLALYLLSFILVYLRWPVPWTASDFTAFTPHSIVMYVLQPLAVIGLCWMMLQGGFSLGAVFMAWAAFFATALACHGEIARDRPDPKHLTEYFLLMSVGGAVGGFLNAIVAPMLFAGVYEFYIAVAVACYIRPVMLESNWLDNLLLNAGMRDWAREQSDQMSRSLGRVSDGSTYVLSYGLDILLGIFMAFLAWFMTSHQFGWDWWTPTKAYKTLKFLGFGERGAEMNFSLFYAAVVYGIPLVMCGLYSSRPLRFGLAITALLCVNLWWWPAYAGANRDILFQGRTYFGVLRVLESSTPSRREGDDLLINPQTGEPHDREEFEQFAKNPKDPTAKPQIFYKYTYLMHGTTYHGRNYIYRPDEDHADLSRLATTYYHRYGPVGAVMEKFNWLPGPQNTYWADARGPTAVVGLLATFGASPLPYDALLNAAVSEPPYATIGLGTGTMASYCRPYQHLTFYEIDKQIRDFSLPPSGDRAFFTYLLGAIRRGANLEVVMGDARLTMEHQREGDPRLTPEEALLLKNRYKEIALYPELPGDRRTGAEGEDNGGNRITARLHPSTMFQNREHYYKAIEVDAFSSDAIPVHLITQEAIEMYLNKITYDGVVMVHTSNRHLDLVQPVARIVEVLDDKFKERYKERVAELESQFKAGKINEETKEKYKEMYKAYSRVKCLVGKDSGRDAKGELQFIGLFGSEYVMVFYDDKYLKPPQNYAEPRGNIFRRSVVRWGPPTEVARYPWTDDFSNLVKIMRW
jgi:hypothetical protein